MPTFRTTVAKDRRVTLPSVLCRRLHIREGTPVEFFLTVDGYVHFHAITGTTRSLLGDFNFKKREPPVSTREMDDGIAESIIEDFRRIEGQSRPSRKAQKPNKTAAE
jgi:bifunctional DNA-binding transcriptional regulator/antitoxin component of YhaV-PrlF toxin-antitoxin module